MHFLTNSLAFSDDAYLPPLEPEGDTAYEADGLNRLTRADGVDLSYDPASNLTFDGRWVHSYDAENRLIRSVESTGGAGAVNTATQQTVYYHYGPAGRRLSKLVYPNGTGGIDSQLTEYVYLGDEPIMDIADRSAVDSFVYVNGAGVDERLYAEQYLAGGGIKRRYAQVNHAPRVGRSAGADLRAA